MSKIARLLGVKKVVGEKESCRTCAFSGYEDHGSIIYLICKKNMFKGAKILAVSHPKCLIYVNDPRRVSERIKAWQQMN